MTLLPLFPSRTSELVGPPGSSGSCRFCGLRTHRWLRATRHGDEVVPACLVCSLCHGLDRPRIADEVTPIWLPEMTQRALGAIMRRLHLICHQHNQPPTMVGVPAAGIPILSQAWGLNMALRRRASVAKSRLGTNDMSELAEALDDATRAGARDPAMLGGLRLLPLGRFFDDHDTDIYPAFLADLANSQIGVAA